MTEYKPIIEATRSLRAQRKSFRQSTFSKKDLKQLGLSKQEIEQLKSVNWHDEVRYEENYIRCYLEMRKFN